MLMHDGHFRHLPVVENSAVVGILSIGKCLFDAIKRLEQASKATQVLQESLEEELKTSQIKNMIGSLLMNNTLFSFTLASLVEKDTSAPAPRVGRQTFVSAAVAKMAATRKAALVVEGRQLVGLFSPLELVMRVIALGKDPQTTLIGDVMAVEPECGSPDMV